MRNGDRRRRARGLGAPMTEADPSTEADPLGRFLAAPAAMKSASDDDQPEPLIDGMLRTAPATDRPPGELTRRSLRGWLAWSSRELNPLV